MVLNNVALMGKDSPVNIRIAGDKITAVSGESGSDGEQLQLNFTNAFVFPGLVNSHDHLDFNLFPALGKSTYQNYTEWGKHIHETYKDEIASVLKVPVLLREQWGIVKNLLCGVTTVVNHGNKIQNHDTLINVHERYNFLHSVRFEKKWKMKLNKPFTRKLPVVVHIGEGKDFDAHWEIDQLINWNLFRRTLIGVHAVAMTEEQAKNFRAVVWCPQSNFFLLNTTAPINRLKKETTIVFGTDSTLTSNWNIWNHIRFAREIRMLNDEELYRSLNANAADVWQTSCNEIKPGAVADLVVGKIKDEKGGLNVFFATNPEDILLVVHQGHIRLFDESLYGQLAHTDLSGYGKIYVHGVCKYIQGDVPGLIKKIKQYYPGVRFPIAID